MVSDFMMCRGLHEAQCCFSLLFPYCPFSTMLECSVWVMGVRNWGAGKSRARCFIPKNGRGLGVRNE